MDTSVTAEPRQKEISMRVVKAAAVQLSPVLYSREGTVEKVVRKIHKLGWQGVQFATFPETVVPYYPYFSFVQPPFRTSQDLSSGSCLTKPSRTRRLPSISHRSRLQRSQRQ